MESLQDPRLAALSLRGRAAAKRHARLVGAAAALALIASLAAGRGLATLCVGTVSAYPAIAAAEEAAVGEARTAASESPPAILARARVQTLAFVLLVKQSDYVAFPAHAAVGFALEAGRCRSESSGDQWRKAAAHAWAWWPAALAAAGLQRTFGVASGPDSVEQSLRAYAAAEPWHKANLDRVLGRLRQAE